MVTSKKNRHTPHNIYICRKFLQFICDFVYKGPDSVKQFSHETRKIAFAGGHNNPTKLFQASTLARSMPMKQPDKIVNSGKENCHKRWTTPPNINRQRKEQTLGLVLHNIGAAILRVQSREPKIGSASQSIRPTTSLKACIEVKSKDQGISKFYEELRQELANAQPKQEYLDTHTRLHAEKFYRILRLKMTEELRNLEDSKTLPITPQQVAFELTPRAKHLPHTPAKKGERLNLKALLARAREMDDEEDDDDETPQKTTTFLETPKNVQG